MMTTIRDLRVLLALLDAFDQQLRAADVDLDLYERADGHLMKLRKSLATPLRTLERAELDAFTRRQAADAVDAAQKGTP
jgi:hypothetical protein